MIEKIVELDFENRRSREISERDVAASVAAGHFVFIDLMVANAAEAEDVIAERFPSTAPFIRELIGDELDTGYTPYPDVLHVYLVACDLDDREVTQTRVDFVMGEGFAVLVTRRDAHLMHSFRREYLNDFRRFARSPSFLVYELFDHHVRACEWVQGKFQRRGEDLHRALLQGFGNRTFGEVTRLSANLLLLRRHVAPCRAVLNELSTRRSPFVTRTTQEFLRSMVAEMDRLLNEINVDRDILNDAVAGAVSLITYRTNLFINRLTIVSFVFLPLTFLVGVYGMNFEHQPEYKWRYGYLFFWCVAAVVVAAASVLIQRTRRQIRPDRAARRSVSDDPA